jgi:hypothetical protein
MLLRTVKSDSGRDASMSSSGILAGGSRACSAIHIVLLALLCALGLITACGAPTPASTPRPTAPPVTATATSLPPIKFPEDVNPLSGQPVADPSLLKVPALLVSISHFPATGRPQAGLSFAPFVYEFYITEGATRFLAVFHGEWPRPEAPLTGGCETRVGPFVQSGILVGNRAWLDANGNGLQDPGEEGVSGLCVNLYDENGNLIQRASTDSNGYYGFNVEPGKYSLEFEHLEGYDFSAPNAGDDSLDSDIDRSSGRAAIDISSDDRSVDAGFLPNPGSSADSSASRLPLPQVGPVRSGRLVYSYIAGYFDKSCLIYAFASEEVLARLPQCHMVFHQLSAGGYMMDLTEMQSVVEETLQSHGSDFNYASNLYSATPPPSGSAAPLLKVYFSYQNQSGWAYDPLSQAYLRYVDTSEYDQAGILHPDTDRLTGRQLHVENVIVLYAQHDVVSPTNLNIRLDPGRTGRAVLFRNGQVFKITWSTIPQETSRGQVHPIQFVDREGRPVPLQPGHTWVIVVTPDSRLEETSPGQWLLNFTQPPGAK